jgi:hypothetical protein
LVPTLGRTLVWSATFAVGLVLAAPAAPEGVEQLPCFGAASRDPERPCVDPSLWQMVVPTPDDAPLAPNLPCSPVEQDGLLLVCQFGAPPAEALGKVAVLGDSHAQHWRPAVDVAARAIGSTALELTRPTCPPAITRADLRPIPRNRCVAWKRQAIGWLAAHPEVHVVLVAASARWKVRTRHGRTSFEALEDGYLRTLRALPPSVTRVIVIRDSPTEPLASHDCVRRAMALGQPAGTVCATPRRKALPPDPAVTAARRMTSGRVRVIDLGEFFCSRRLCHPVIGGALVHRDRDHLTRVFAATLGPYLLRKLAPLVAAS